MSIASKANATSPARGRPTAARASAIEAAIFDAARKLFLADGFEQTSMEAVAAQAGVSRTTLYGRFRNKAILLRSLIDAQVQEWGRQQRLLRDPMPTDFKQRLHHQARSIIQMAISDDVREFQRLRMAAAAGNAEYDRVLMEIGYKTAVIALERELAAGCQGLGMSPRNTMHVAEMLMALLSGWVTGRSGTDDVSAEAAIAYADQAVDILYAGRSEW